MREDPEQFDFPAALGDAIGQAYSHRLAIPPTVDAAIVSAVRAEFGRRRRMRLVVRWGGGVAAALAASVVLMILLRPARVPVNIVKGDLDGSGKVDMVDAMLLAKRIRAGQTDLKLDLTGDGRVDQKDADALASAAVSLGKKGVAQRLPTMSELGIAQMSPSSAGVNRAMVAGAPRRVEGRGEGLVAHIPHMPASREHP